MDGALEVVETQHPLSANAVVARVRLIQQVMKDVMKEGTHFGTIPGCQKPSLWKPGAEQLLVTFRIAPDDPKVEDLSTGDSVRYRVSRIGRDPSGRLIAAGVGECSSDEEKYKWRSPVCDAEYDATPEDRRRQKFKRDGTSYKQVRTNPADVANTILKMADKRAFIAMTLLATAASDIFTQDLEDLPPEVAQSIEGSDQPAKPPVQQPTLKKAAPAPADGQTVEGVVADVSERPVKTKDGEKVVYTVVAGSGQKFETWEVALADKAVPLKGTDTRVVFGFKNVPWTNKKGESVNSYKLLSVEPAPEQVGA